MIIEVLKQQVMQRLNKALNVESFTRNFLSTEIGGYTILNELTG